MLIDSHAHLTDNRLNSKEIINNMSNDELEALITVGYDVQSSIGCVEYACQNNRVFAAVGIHPSETTTATHEDLKKIETLLNHDRVVAYGEIGLDYHYEDTVKQKQKEFLELQVDLSIKYDLPIIFHLRDAYLDFDEFIKNKKNLRAVMHCYSGSKESAKKYLDLGFYVSFAGAVTFKNATTLSEVAAYIPNDRLMAETDCPYLTPVPHRGELNYPKYVRHVVEKLAQVRGDTFENIAKLTSENTRKLFSKMKI